MAHNDPLPFYETPKPAKAERGILLISYHFPPSRAVGGVRWQKLSRFAAECGWQIDVVTLDPKDLLDPDLDRLRELPEGVRVFGVAQPRVPLEGIADRVSSSLRSFRRNRMVDHGPSPESAPPEATSSPASFSTGELNWELISLVGWRRLYSVWFHFAENAGWSRQAERVALQVCRPGFHKVIVSCGPPHMVYGAARWVSQRTGLPFVVDMRDPWSLVERVPGILASPLFSMLARRYERKAIADAQLIVANTEAARDALAARYPQIESRSITVMNGYDDEPLPAPSSGERFLLAYAGTVYLDRDPSQVFRAAGRIVKEFQLTPELFGFVFIGDMESGYPIKEIAEREGLPQQFLTLEPTCSRRQLWERLSQAVMLVSLPQDSHMAIPSKIFEYMRFNAWLLALAEPGSATEVMLRGSGADVVGPHDTEAIAAILRERYRQFAAGMRPVPLAKDARLSRATQARILLDAIEQICK